MAIHYRFLDLRNCVYPAYSQGPREAVAGKGEKVEGIRQNAEEAYAMRAATLAACERVIEIAKQMANEPGKSWLSEIDAMGLDGYLWQKAKDGDLRNVSRFSERGTVFY